MAEEKNVETINTQQEQSAAANPHMNGSLFDRRFIAYDKVKLSLKTMDIIIAVLVLLLITAFLMGVYKR